MVPKSRWPGRTTGPISSSCPEQPGETLLQVRHILHRYDLAPGAEDADGPVEPPGSVLERELVDGADPIGRADRDVWPLAPGFEVLVEITRDTDEPLAIVRDVQPMSREVTPRAKSPSRRDAFLGT